MKNTTMTGAESDRTIPEIAVRYAEEVRRRIGSHVRKIILFGSQARGEGTNESDFDFIVVLDKRDHDLREAVIDAGVTMLNATDRLCASLVYGEDQWTKALAGPLGWNVQREGVDL